MSETVSVTVIGYSSSRLNSLETSLQEYPDLDVSRKLLLEGHIDPFEDLPSTTNVVVLDLSDNWQEVLHAITSRSRRHRRPMVLVGPSGDAEMVRHALRAGARDFQTHPVNAKELADVIRQVGNEQPDTSDVNLGDLVVFVGAKGGSGSTAIACSLAHALKARDKNAKILVLDLDMQYGSLPLNFDVQSNSNLAQALASGERIDATVLDSCLGHTPEGIDVLSTFNDSVFSPWEVNAQTISNLLNLIQGRYDHVIADMPKHIDPINFQAIERSKSICIVMQQSLADLRVTRQIIGLLRDQGVANDRLKVVINRHDKRNVVRKQDIEDAFENHVVFTLPNDFKRMSFSVDNAVSVIAKWRSAPVSRNLNNLAMSLWPETEKGKRGWFGRRKAS